MRKKTEKFILCVLILSFLAGLGGCSVRPRAARTENGERLFRIGFSGAPDSLNPYAAAGDESAAVLSLLYDTLFALDTETGEYVGSLCQEWTVEDGAARGGKLWKLTLRPGVVWHDGTPLTASDVEFSLQSAKDFSNLFSYPELELLDATGIAVNDDTHLAFIVWGDVPYMEELLSRVPILPRHIWNGIDGVEYNSSGVPRNILLARENLYSAPADRSTMIGSGPFVWDGWKDGALVLRRNGSYWNGIPTAQVVELRFACVNGADLVKAKELDACWDLTAPAYERLRKKAGLRVAQGGRNELYLFYLNLRDGSSPLASENVRKALDACLDRDGALACFGGGVTALGLLNRSSPWFYEDAIQSRREFSVESANYILESAGYADRDGDGVREAAQGRSLSFEVLCSDASPAWTTAAEAWRDHCARAGVELRVRAVPPDELYAALGSGEYDILFGAQRCYSDPFYAMGTFYWADGGNAWAVSGLRGRASSPGWNVTGYHSERFDQLYREMLTLKGGERKEAVAEMGAMLYDSAAVLPVGFPAARQVCAPAWFDLRSSPGEGLLFTPEIFRQQMLRLKTVGRK